MIVPNLPNSENYNPYGFIFEDKLFIAREYGLTSVELNEIKSVKLANNRDLKINFFSTIISVVALYFFFFYLEYNFIYKILLLLIIIPTSIFAVFDKKHHSKLIVITKNYQLITTDVSTTSKKQAEEIVLKVNNVLVNNFNVSEAC